jgi:hypothetical protein
VLGVPGVAGRIELVVLIGEGSEAAAQGGYRRLDWNDPGDRTPAFCHYDGHARFGDLVEERQATLLELACGNNRFFMSMNVFHGHIVQQMSNAICDLRPYGALPAG